MIRIYYKGLDGEQVKRLEGDYRRMTEKGIKKVADKTIELMHANIMNAKPYPAYWTGALYDSVQAIPITRTQIQIITSTYGSEVEEGHMIPPGRLPALLSQWAGKKLGDMAIPWLRKVRREGHAVIGRFFIDNTVRDIGNQIHWIMLENLRLKR